MVDFGASNKYCGFSNTFFNKFAVLILHCFLCNKVLFMKSLKLELHFPGVLFITLFFFLASFSSIAQKYWTLEDCVEYALQNNLDIKKQLEMVESKKATRLQSGLSMLPSVNANATNVWNWGQTIDMYTNTFATTNVRSNNLYVSSDMTLFAGLQKFNTLKKNNIELMASNYDLEVLKNDISLAVAGYYLDILFSYEILAVAREQLSTTTDQVERIRKMVDAGSSARGDLLNIEAQASNEELLVIEAENRLSIANLSLQQLIDLTVTKDFMIERPNLKMIHPPVDTITADIIYEKALRARPEIKSAELRMESARKSLAIAQGGYSPILSFGGSWGTGYSGARTEDDPDQPSVITPYIIGITQNSRDSVWSAYESTPQRTVSFKDQLRQNDNKSIGLYLTIPIFNGWQVQNNISQAKIQRDIADINYESAKRTLRKTIEQAYADAVAALKKYNSSSGKVQAQQESFNYATQKFEVGMVTSFDYNNSKKELIRAESELLQAKYDFIFKVTILDFYMGNPIRIIRE